VGVSNRELVQGTLEMLVLKTLALESMHGYGIALRIEQVSDGVFRVNPGSLLPALSRMERAGRIRGEWRSTENNRRAKILHSDCRPGVKHSNRNAASGAARSRLSNGFSKPERGRHACEVSWLVCGH